MNQASLRVDDEWFTPKHAWEDIAHLIPRDAVLWEAFSGNGQSAEYLRELGFEVVCDGADFFESDPKGDIVVTNPPFSKSKRVLQRLVELQMPFLMILPCCKVTTQHFQRMFAPSLSDLKLIVPRKRINFTKPGMARSKATFDTFYYAWRVPSMADLPNLNFL